MDDTTHPRAALITGAGRRIGPRDRYTVVLHANHSRTAAETLAGEIVGGRAKASVVLADPQTVRKLVPAAAAFAPLTLLVNNASEIETDDIATLERACLGRQSGGAVVSGAALCLAARAPGRRCLDRQYRRPARAQADAAVFLLHLEQKRARSRDRHARAETVRQRRSTLRRR